MKMQTLKCWGCGHKVWVRHMRWYGYSDGSKHGTCASCIAFSILNHLANCYLPT